MWRCESVIKLKEGSIIICSGSDCMWNDEAFSMLLRKITVDEQPKKNTDEVL